MKTFEEIMEEKKAKRLGRFGGAPSKEDLSNRKLKVTQAVSQRNHERPKDPESSKLWFLLVISLEWMCIIFCFLFRDLLPSLGKIAIRFLY